MADEYSVFDMAGAPLGAPLLRPLGAADTTLVVPLATQDALGNPELLQIGSEWVRKTAVGLEERIGLGAITARVGAADTTLTVQDSGLFYANPALGLTDPVTISNPIEGVVVTDVLDATHVAISRTAPVAHELVAGALDVTFSAGVNERWTVSRGVLGTSAASHSRWATVQRLYRPTEFVKRAELSDLVRVYLFGTSLVTLARIDLPAVTVRGRGAPLGLVVPLEAGATVLMQVDLETSEFPAPSHDIYLQQVADATGVPVAPGLYWGAYGATVIASGTSTRLRYDTDDGANVFYSRPATGPGIVVAQAGWYSVEATSRLK